MAYIVTDSAHRANKNLDREIREFLRTVLPEHMMSAALVFLDAMPLTVNGKVDRAALPPPDFAQSIDFVPAQTQTECLLVEIWEQVLGLIPISIQANFFDYGGHSLLAARLIERIHQKSGKAITLSALLRHPTIAELAPIIDAIPCSSSELPNWETDAEGRFEPFPLTDIQNAYLQGRSADFGLGGVSTHGYAELPVRNLDPDLFERIWNRLIERHDMLRMVVTVDGQQRILPTVPIYRITRYDFRACDSAASEH